MKKPRLLIEEWLPAAARTEAAWWLGLMSGNKRSRAIRALRIPIEAVK